MDRLEPHEPVSLVLRNLFGREQANLGDRFVGADRVLVHADPGVVELLPEPTLVQYTSTSLNPSLAVVWGTADDHPVVCLRVYEQRFELIFTPPRGGQVERKNYSRRSAHHARKWLAKRLEKRS